MNHRDAFICSIYILLFIGTGVFFLTENAEAAIMFAGVGFVFAYFIFRGMVCIMDEVKKGKR